MSFLKRLSFFGPPVRPVGDTLESGDIQNQISRKRRQIAFKIGMIVSLIVVTMIAFPRGTVYQYTVQMDEIWRQPNLHAPFTFAINKPAAELESERQAVRLETPPVFTRVQNAQEDVRDRAEQLRGQLQRILVHYGQFQLNQTRGRTAEALRDSVSYRSSYDSLTVRFTRPEWTAILTSYAAVTSGMAANSRGRQGGMRLDRETLDAALQIMLDLMNPGILDLDKSTISSDSLSVRNEVTFKETPTSVNRVFDVAEALEEARDRLALRWLGDENRLAIAEKMFGWLLFPNLEYDREGTEELWAVRVDQIVPTMGIVRENEVIVRQGDRVTADIRLKIESLQNELIQQSGGSIPWKTLSGHFLLSIATFLIFFLYLFLLRRPIFDDNRLVLLITLLFLGVISVYGIALRAALLDMYVVPVAIVAILLTVIFDSRVAIFGSLTMALIGSHLLNYDFAFTFATLFASTLGIFSVRDIRNRSQFFVSASVVFAGYMLVLGANLLLQNTPMDRFTDLTIFVAINSVLLLLAYPALWLFERAFGVTTDLTLLELSDTNRPLLKDLSMKAPGTFNHVLQVANLAETAAAAIGANALLTRVGALYHDIGKMVKPEYFVENQRGGVNPHDGLKPRMSALIIASHVKEGIDLARRNRLPRIVEEFIPMHHGTMRIEYFYQRALKQTKEGDPPVQESDFRYPGPDPCSKETSILMLADGIEAASRTVENPSHKRLSALIESMVESRRVDGLLDDTDLTFAELRKIKEAFLGVLTGIYHVRVKYPGEEDEAASDETGWSGDQTANALDG